MDGWSPEALDTVSCTSSSDEDEDEDEEEGEAAAWGRAALLASFTEPRWVGAAEAIGRRASRSGVLSEDDAEDDQEQLRDSDEHDDYISDSGSATSQSETSSSSWTSLRDRQDDANDGPVDGAALIAHMDRAARCDGSMTNEWTRTEDILNSIEWADRAPWQNDVLPEKTLAFCQTSRRRSRRSRMSQLSGGSTTVSSIVSRSLSLHDFDHLSQSDIAGMADDVKIATVQEHLMRQDVRDATKASEILRDYAAKRSPQMALEARRQARARAEELRRLRMEDLENRDEFEEVCTILKTGSSSTSVEHEDTSVLTPLAANPMSPPQAEEDWLSKVPKLHEKVEQRPILAPTRCLRACLHKCTCRDAFPLAQTTKQIQRESANSLSDTSNRLAATSHKVAERPQLQRRHEKTVGLEETDVDQGIEKHQRELAETRTALLDRLAKAREIVRAEQRAGPSPQAVPHADIAASSGKTRTSTTQFRLPPAQGAPRPLSGNDRGSSSERHRRGGPSSGALDSVTIARCVERLPTERVLSCSPDEIIAQILAEGNEALAMGRHDAVIQVFEQALQVYPGHPTLAARLAHAKTVKREVNRVVGTWLRTPGASGIGSKRPSPSAIRSLKIAERCAAPIARKDCRPQRGLAYDCTRPRP